MHVHDAALPHEFAAAIKNVPQERASGLAAAMVAATAAGLYPSLDAACIAMQQGGRERAPDAAARQHYDKDYRIFLEMLRQRQAIDAMA